MKTFLCLGVGLVVIFALAEARGVSLPKELQSCPREDNACLTEAIEKAFPILAKGSPRLGMLPLDPLRVTEIFIDQGSGPVSIKLALKNQDFLGISQTHITNVKSNMDDKNYRMEVDGTIPKFVLLGDYKIEGKVLVLPIIGEGKDNLTLADLKAKVIITGHVIEKDGEEYINLDSLIFTFDTSRLYIDFTNLFNGDKVVSDNMIQFLNDNWSDILHELKPSLEEAASAVFKEICVRIYSRVPYAALHPNM